ncbi:uncharacterized protein MELLADRAFT_103977 [Melampsora larici-populina 98AG31]|uniref:Uncharacterized protein n=1 Tax=Melampsora larici-populina (strain 98AG31 / pathotype 3-4-7) TaxID=747676 RepID=F4RCA7_MELLP|nr:uncharacterized protein MELLADRAFT_103977 [Melampsora larici-populina 98AG31]EGG09867.1 hypothetical protein MELLADRAFT_103977 [Melampsora larici-populina 98AG31]
MTASCDFLLCFSLDQVPPPRPAMLVIFSTPAGICVYRVRHGRSVNLINVPPSRLASSQVHFASRTITEFEVELGEGGGLCALNSAQRLKVGFASCFACGANAQLCRAHPWLG